MIDKPGSTGPHPSAEHKTEAKPFSWEPPEGGKPVPTSEIPPPPPPIQKYANDVIVQIYRPGQGWTTTAYGPEQVPGTFPAPPPPPPPEATTQHPGATGQQHPGQSRPTM